MRYINTLSIIALATLLAVGCNTTKRNDQGNPLPRFEEFCFEEVGPSYEVKINYQRITNTDKGEALALIDATNFRRTFSDVVYDQPELLDADAAARAIVEEMKEEISLIEGSANYISQIDQAVMLVRNERVLCVETAYYNYMGGVHGIEGIIYDCYDIATGQAYDFGYLVDGQWGSAMRAKIFEKLNAQYGDVLIDVSKDNIHIPESVLINDTGITLIYQPYEVAPYSEGHLSVEFTDEELQSIGVPLLWCE